MDDPFGEPEQPSKLRQPASQEPTQSPLFDKGEWYDEHWKGMPEYVSKDLTPLKTIYVHFEKREDVAAFAKLVGQTVTMNTQSIWFPEAEIGRIVDKRYIDSLPKESNEADAEVLDSE